MKSVGTISIFKLVEIGSSVRSYERCRMKWQENSTAIRIELGERDRPRARLLLDSIDPILTVIFRTTLNYVQPEFRAS